MALMSLFAMLRSVGGGGDGHEGLLQSRYLVETVTVDCSNGPRDAQQMAGNGELL